MESLSLKNTWRLSIIAALVIAIIFGTMILTTKTTYARYGWWGRNNFVDAALLDVALGGAGGVSGFDGSIFLQATLLDTVLGGFRSGWWGRNNFVDAALLDVALGGGKVGMDSIFLQATLLDRVL